MYLLFLGNVHFKFEIKRCNRNLVSRYVHFKYQNVHLKIALGESVVKMYIFKPQTLDSLGHMAGWGMDEIFCAVGAGLAPGLPGAVGGLWGGLGGPIRPPRA